MDVSARFIEFCKFKNVRQIDFVKWKVTSNQTINNIFRKGTTPNISVIVGLAQRHPDINLKWLLLGQGEMIEHENILNDPRTAYKLMLKDSDKCALLEKQLNECNNDKKLLMKIVENLTSKK